MATVRPTITLTPRAFELMRKHMDKGGALRLPIRVSLDCMRGVWVADAKAYVRRGDVTLPKGSDMGGITDMRGST